MVSQKQRGPGGWQIDRNADPPSDPRRQTFFSLRNPMPLKIRVCSHCQAEFVPNNGKQRFCTDQCRYEFKNKRKSDALWEAKERERQLEITARRAARERQNRRSFPQAEGSTTARGYGARHQAERKRWAPLVQAGLVVCVRCGLLIEPGSRWALDHDDDKVHYLGPAHFGCNAKAAAQLGNRRMREKKQLEDQASVVRSTSREW
jgi:hypothetical protein